MIQLKSLSASLLALEIILSLGSRAWGAEDFISKVPDSTGKYCHLRFPAIREESLFWDRPVLKDPSEGDIIDFYGPCDHDPLGRDEVRRQRDYLQRQQYREHGGD